jgi:predicted acylesterase/phospholipase RssA
MFTRHFLSSILLLLYIFMTSCASVPERKPLPEDLSELSNVPGFGENIRFWGDNPPPFLPDWEKMSRSELSAKYPDLVGREHNYLAISGGGANGALGAGLLIGWTETGNRPEFSIVTGVSTGALTAPFAFLGSAYDAQLREVYTSYSTKDLVKLRNKLAMVTGDAVASTEPLQAVIAKYVNEDMLQAIAKEYRDKGRTLLIGTTNLDAMRPVIWNISRIASSGNPNALELVRKLLLASASIPVAFPPVYIEVEANGQRYDEMHVDGGAANQVFLYPLGIDWQRVIEMFDVKGTPSVYVIRNSRLAPQYQDVSPKLGPIAGRTIDSLIRNQGIGDMFRMYLGARRDGLDYHLAVIPADFQEKSKEPFDLEYMGKLFDLGYRMAKQGYPWEKVPPGMDSE